MKYKLTIHDTETGENLEHDTNLIMVGFANENLEDGCTAYTLGRGSAREIVQLCDGMEELKKRVYKECPAAALMKAVEDATGVVGGRTVDLSEMLRGRHGGGEHD